MNSPFPAVLHQHTARLLEQLLRFEHPADATVQQYFRKHSALGSRDRARVGDAVFGCLRHLRRLRHAAGEGAGAEALVAAWAAGAWQTQDATALTPAEQADLPDWLWARWPWPAETAMAVAEAFKQPAPLDLRVNILKAKREAVQAALAAAGIETVAGRWAPQALRVIGKPALQRHALMVDGSIEVQDEGSQLLGHLLGARRGEQIVDFCAGAGGKSLQIGALMRNSGRVHAFDVSAGRLSELAQRAKRAGLANVQPMAIRDELDARLSRLAGKVDRVLVDAPCSGLGTLRRNPDLKWRQGPEQLADKAALQASILMAAARLVKPGGVLVYATCSPMAEENEAVVEAFVAEHPAFAVEPALPALAKQGIDLPQSDSPYLRLDPFHHDTDGFFAARLVRCA
ncbi:RsmB/NOP family class I SAM-dependent RNA methyltransferase [Denitromonas iodatirespirans]|uniref:RsmB/NOP family class I SAM-dependent RNA methyltransferase n=1 Tax=Denitromonas iodatirespirans TaxID=2795389 RepID=A0A944DBP1_DENI1|nr:RsmB/NOP family class I SAM-dependent RNA methyltransferase [Denitromonas iodatirespirans]MBT0963539.1 RsmB/NOP family class I SAM-dependent RNA methyltransferase [Denitromonas iodatirespirans]